MKKPIPAKKTYVYVKPAMKKRPGADEATQLKIRDPRTGRHIPSHGAKVELTTDVSRMLRAPKANRPKPPRLHRGPDLVKISKDDFDKGLEDIKKAAEATAKKVEREAKAAAKKVEDEAEAVKKKADEEAPKAVSKGAETPAK